MLLYLKFLCLCYGIVRQVEVICIDLCTGATFRQDLLNCNSEILTVMHIAEPESFKQTDFFVL
jgi:hypothetical protein